MLGEYIPGELIYFAHRLPAKFKELIILPISDIHYGDPLFSQKHLNRVRDFILDNPNVYIIFNGDLCNCALRNSASDSYSATHTPEQQRDYLIEYFMPVKNRILGMTDGNHEARIYRDTSIDICKDMAKAWGCPYRPNGILLKVSFGGGNGRHPDQPYSYFLYATHGYGGARTKAAKAVKVERTSTMIHADCYIMGHDHDLNIASSVYLIPDARTYLDKKSGFTIGSVKAVDKKLVKSGAFMKWGNYAERGGFNPVSLDLVKIKLMGTGKRRILIEV